MSLNDAIPHITEGPITPNAILENFVSGAASIPLWAPVVISAAATQDTRATVTKAAVAGDPLVIGVAVGGAHIDAENAFANKAVGDLVSVCVFGPCKCVVAANIVVGDGLVTQVTTGYGVKGTYATDAEAVFAKALMASDFAADIIEVFVGKGGTMT